MSDVTDLKRPPLFRWLDALTFGGPALIATILAVWVAFQDVESDSPGQAKVLMFVVAGVFWIIYALLVKARDQFLSQFTMMTKHGILINPGGYKVPLEDIEAEVDRMLVLYQSHIPGVAKYIQAVKGGFGKGAAFPDAGYIWVTFAPGPLDHPTQRDAKVAGFVRAGGNHVMVGYTAEAQPPERTALAHELGHLALGRYTKAWDNDTHHKWMKTRGLP